MPTTKEKTSKNTQTRRTGVANKALGRKGEQAAVRFLLHRGYDVVARNWICPAGEADIVARDDNTVVFIEVKTRSTVEKGLPEEAVNKEKRARYERIAAFFLSDYPVSDVAVRFDVISILVIHESRAFVRHHINAFGFE